MIDTSKFSGPIGLAAAVITVTHALAVAGGIAVGKANTVVGIPAADVAALVDHLAFDEGFRGSFYTDSRGVATIGYGTTNITEPEARCVLTIRADSVVAHLGQRWEPYLSQTDSVQVALGDMAYQLGVTGLLRFDTFLGLIEQGDIAGAVEDARGTAWYGQTTNRAERVIKLLEAATDDDLASSLRLV